MFYVIMTHNFDAETCTYGFENETKALAFLHWAWEEYYNVEIAEGSHLCESQCYYENDYAKVEWDDGCYTEWNLVEGLDEISAEFEKVWERYIP